MAWRWVWVCLLGTSAWLLTGRAFAQCTKDIECKGDRVCTAGVCADPPTPAAPPPAGGAQGKWPNQPVEEPLGYRRRNPTLMISGIVVESVGVASLITAVTLGVLANQCTSDLDEKYPDHLLPSNGVDELSRCHSYGTYSTIFGIGGLALAVAGIPMIVVGAKKVPIYSARARVIPWLAPDRGGLTLQLDL